MLVLDEADRMLDMGFSEDVMEIASQLPKARQTAFFTATMTRRVLDFADELLTEPAKIEIAAQTAKHAGIEQRAIFVDDIDHKRRPGASHPVATGRPTGHRVCCHQA